MVASVGRYYGTPFKVFKGVVQGDLLSSTILNIVVDLVILNWVMVMAGGRRTREFLEGGEKYGSNLLHGRRDYCIPTSGQAEIGL